MGMGVAGIITFVTLRMLHEIHAWSALQITDDSLAVQLTCQ